MIKIDAAGVDQASMAFDLIEKLLLELGDDDEESPGIDRDSVRRDWANSSGSFTVFVARNESNKPVGVITLIQCFAIYAGGDFGIINELYVIPEYRSQGVGRELLNAVINYARDKGWKRIDVTAPHGNKWERTVRFYEREGFVFTGPKLKYMIT